jgi:hypothetical protein
MKRILNILSYQAKNSVNRLQGNSILVKNFKVLLTSIRVITNEFTSLSSVLSDTGAKC